MSDRLFVFDIQRAAMHDGPGIRTTVFLKGCPLRCRWCHNPESQSMCAQLKYLVKQCVSCGSCAPVCPHGCHGLTNGTHTLDLAACTSCGACVEACPSGALSMLGRWVETEEIVELLRRDSKFFASSGGGLTVSGGEPLMQPESCAALLLRARREGFHTCLDTSGHVLWEALELALPHVDLFLYDYKLTDDAAHRAQTGVSNARILEHLELLCRRDKAVILRCPIIPGINDDEEHLRAIAKLSRRYPAVREVNLMAYHDIARGKLAQIHFDGDTLVQESMDAAQKRQLIKRLRQLGCDKLNESA